MTAAPSPFSPTLPKFQTSWDSTSLGWLKTCPRSYQYQMLEAWEPKSRGVHLVFGGLYAASLERYAHSRAAGEDHDKASVKMVRWALENSGERLCYLCDGTGKLDDERECHQCNGTGGRQSHMTQTARFVPWSPTLPDGTPHPDSNIKNRFTLIRSLVWNVEERLTSPFSTLIKSDGKPAVELSFNFAAFEIEGEVISLSGHMDEVVEADGRAYVRDDKTTGSALGAQYFQRYTPDNQMSLYSVAGKVILNRPIAGVLVKAAQIMVGGTRFQTAQVTRPEAVLTEWLRDTEEWITQARSYAERGHFPMNDKSCFLCAFKRICAVSPSHREAHLREDFVRRAVPWNPLASRGDI